MNIVFWSKCAGKCATSGNMLAVGIMSSLVYSVQGTLMQFDHYSRPIDDVFREKRQVNLLMEEYAYYNQRGIDRLIDKFQMKDLKVEDIKENSIPVKNTNMRYIPGSKRIRSGLDDLDMIQSSKKLLKLLNESSQYNFIDSINGERQMATVLLNNADVIVVNLCQGMNEDILFKDEKLLKKCVFIVGKYDPESKENMSDICKKYGINKEDIANIPYDIAYHDAIQEGKVVQFLIKQITARRTDEHFNFINNVFRATSMVLKKAGHYEKYW